MSERRQSLLTPRNLKWLGVLIGLGVAIAIWLNAQREYQLPGELAGEWRTTDPRYADRSMELSRGYVTLGVGDGKATMGFIQEVSASQEKGNTLYTIIYKGDEGIGRIYLYYSSSHGETIQFKNQPGVVWKKVPDS